MANIIKIKRGLSSNIDNTTLAQGELAITTDTNELYVGKASGKEKINVQANYIQNDEKAADYIKNRPFYSEWNEFFNQEVSFSYKSFIRGDKTYYQLSSNEFDYAFDYGSLLETTGFIISINGTKHILPIYNIEFTIEYDAKTYANYCPIEEITDDLIEIDFRDNGKLVIMIATPNEPSNPEDLSKTVVLSKEVVHKIENKFVEHPLNFANKQVVAGTSFEEPTFVLTRGTYTTLKLYSAGIIVPK